MRTYAADREGRTVSPSGSVGRRPQAAVAKPGGRIGDLLALQSTVGNNAVVRLLEASHGRPATGDGPAVRRAILAIDGKSDNDQAKAATANCLANLASVKSITTAPDTKTPKAYPAGDARGAIYGQDTAVPVRDAAKVGIEQGKVDPAESLYVLGHGDGTTVAGLTAPTMANLLNSSFSGLAGDTTYTGKVKLVACYTASMKSDGRQILGSDKKPIKRPYAAELAAQLVSKAGKCRPNEVQGIAGIAWVDEETGKKTGFDVTKESQMNPLEEVYLDGQLEKQWMAALGEKDPKKRKAEMDRILRLAQDKHPQLKGKATRVVGPESRKGYTGREDEPWHVSLMNYVSSFF